MVLLPMLFLRMDTMGYDGVFSHSVEAVNVYTSGSLIIHASESIFTLAKSTTLAVFPIFFIFLPLGIYGFFRNRNFDKYVILLFLIFMSLPIIYASVREIAEPRYFLTLFPILSLFSIYTVKEIIRKWPITKPFSPSIKFVPFNKIKIQNNTNKKLKILFSRITSKKFNLVSTI